MYEGRQDCQRYRCSRQMGRAAMAARHRRESDDDRTTDSWISGASSVRLQTWLTRALDRPCLFAMSVPHASPRRTIPSQLWARASSRASRGTGSASLPVSSGASTFRARRVPLDVDRDLDPEALFAHSAASSTVATFAISYLPQDNSIFFKSSELMTTEHSVPDPDGGVVAYK